MKYVSLISWLVIVSGLFFGHFFTMVSLSVAILYIICLRLNRDSWKSSSKYWEDDARDWYEVHLELLESNPEDVRKAVEEYQIKQLTK